VSDARCLTYNNPVLSRQGLPHTSRCCENLSVQKHACLSPLTPSTFRAHGLPVAEGIEAESIVATDTLQPQAWAALPSLTQSPQPRGAGVGRREDGALAGLNHRLEPGETEGIARPRQV
jgi:hypothetical protein